MMEEVIGEYNSNNDDALVDSRRSTNIVDMLAASKFQDAMELAIIKESLRKSGSMASSLLNSQASFKVRSKTPTVMSSMSKLKMSVDRGIKMYGDSVIRPAANLRNPFIEYDDLNHSKVSHSFVQRNCETL